MRAQRGPRSRVGAPSEKNPSGATDRLGWTAARAALPVPQREAHMARANRILSAYRAWQDRLITTGEALEMAEVDTAGELIAAARWAASRSGRSAPRMGPCPPRHTPPGMPAPR